jgi:hypothetical protein
MSNITHHKIQNKKKSLEDPTLIREEMFHLHFPNKQVVLGELL